ncbi:MAG: hypothetical protein IJT34_01675, partial [Butyrivibrio sp.]|nr:hypothetical protein [Butyrivibrio sp.]
MIQDKIFKDKKIARPFYVGLAALILMCICSVVMSVKLVILRDNELKALTVGTNAVGIFFCTAIYPGCILGIRHNRAIARFFGVMLLLTGMTQLLEISMILLDERPPFRMLLLSASILYGILERVILFALWRYVIALFRIEPDRVQASNRFVAVMLVPSTLLCLIDLWTPFFGGVDATGNYFLAGHQLLDMSYGIIVCLAIAITMVRVGIRPGRILTVLSYILIPGVVLGLTWNKPDLNIQHVASALTLTLIYSVLNSESARRTAAMEKELSMAGQIQNSMLPDVDTDTSIPPQVELYASMQPAKEV